MLAETVALWQVNFRKPQIYKNLPAISSQIDVEIQEKTSGKPGSLTFALVGLGGLEPQTSSMSTKRSNQLSYNPDSIV